jgi:CRP/FNR family transcriptional regulator
MTISTIARILPTRHRVSIDCVSAPKSKTIAQISTTHLPCRLCKLCLPWSSLDFFGMDVANRQMFIRSRLHRGELLYRIGDRFTTLYAVCSGFLKSTAMLENGQDQVTGFSMPGEVLGMDGIGAGRHSCNAVALEDSDVCAIPFARLQVLTQQWPSLQRQFHNIMGREIERQRGMMLLLGSMNAEKRLAAFLLDLSHRFAACGNTPSEFNVRMTREEIASYLGLTLATVSRIFSRFKEDRLIGVRQKAIRFLDSTRLESVFGRVQH